MEHLGNSWLVSSILSYGLSVNPEAEKNIFVHHHFPMKIAIDLDYLWLFCCQVFRHTRLTQILSFAASTAFFMVLYPCFHLNDALVCFSPHLVGVPAMFGIKRTMMFGFGMGWFNPSWFYTSNFPTSPFWQSSNFFPGEIAILPKIHISLGGIAIIFACLKVSGPSRERSARFNDPCFAEPGTMGRCGKISPEKFGDITGWGPQSIAFK